MNTSWMNKVAVPEVKIIEQPSSKGTRFRYECEGRYSNNIFGASGKKSFPTIRILNYKGPLSIIVSCVSKDPPHQPHPHKLVNGNDIYDHGICLFRIPANNKHDISFQHLSVQCIGKKNIGKSLAERERVQIDPFKTGFAHKLRPENIDLNCIRLCFQVFIETTTNLIPLQPIVSEPIYDKKAVNELKICWLSHHSASVAGGTQMCILCEKVSKLDIEVRFFHEESNWEAIAILTKPEVFRQVAIVFKTPEFRTATCSPEEVKEPLNVQIELRRLSDKETSQPAPFQLLPLTSVYYESNVNSNILKRKREKYMEERNGTIAKRIQDEITGKPLVMSANLPQELNEMKRRKLVLQQFGEDPMKGEFWELPSIKQPFYPQQPQLSTAPPINSYANALNVESSTIGTTQVAHLNRYNIESQGLNSTLSPYKKSNSVDTLNSDSWINDLLETINQEKSSPALPPETLIPNNVTYSPNVTYNPKGYFSSSKQINNNSLPYTSAQPTDNFFDNMNFTQESSTPGNFPNNFSLTNIMEEMGHDTDDFYFHRDNPSQRENNIITDENIQDFISLLNDLP